MDNKKSFEKAIINAQLKGATQKMKAIPLAAELAKRGVNIDPGFEQE